MAALPALAAIVALVPGFSVPQSNFVLTSSRDGTLQVVNLICEPNGGLHPRADETCSVLSAVDGDVGGLTPTAVACTMEYAPVRVKATGKWRGEKRTFEAEYPNACVMRSHTGPVFDF